MITVKKITAKETYFLRKEILRKGTDLPVEFKEDLDTDTFHVGVFNNTSIVSIGTFIKNKYAELEGKQYQLRGMATSLEERGMGHGKLLLNFATNVLKELDIDFLWCNARENATNFYLKNGFKVSGNKFMVDQVGYHYKMFKTITHENN